MIKKVYPWDFSVEDAIELLDTETNELVTGIYMELPERTLSENTDQDQEESLNEDRLPFLPISVQCRKSKAEIVFANQRRLKYKSAIPKLNLEEEQEVFKNRIAFPEPNYAQYKGKTPIQIFELFFDKIIIKSILVATINNAKSQKYDLSSLTLEEIKKFLAILLLSGYNKISRPPACYWEAPDVRNELVANSMQQERFLEIYEYISFEVHPQKKPTYPIDRLSTLRSLIKLLQKRFIENLPPEEIINFDECMVDSFQRHNSREMKHIPFGYRVSCLNTPNGYLIDFYVHHSTNNDDLYNESPHGRTAAPLLIMLDAQDKKFSSLPYKIYFGDLNTDKNFFYKLKLRGYTATGIFSLFQSDYAPSLPFPIESQYSFAHNMYVTNVVTDNRYTMITCSTCQSNDPIEVLKSRAKKVINDYQESIIGTDTMIKHIDLYRIGICNTKKWYWPFFTWLLDVSVSNAWLLMQKAGSDISQLDFRRAIVRAYLEEKATAKPPFPARNTSLLT